MKKYSFLVTFIFLLLLTFLSYSYEKEDYKDIIRPSINIESEQLGNIKNIEFYNVNGYPALIILSTKNENGLDYSYLHLFDLNTNEITQLNKYITHKYLDTIITRDNFSSDDIVTAYKDGIVLTKLDYQKDGFEFNSYKQPIDKFENADSMAFKAHLLFTNKNDDLIYIHPFNSSTFLFSSNNNLENFQTYYRKPQYILGASSIYSSLTYTKVNKNRLDLYRMRYNGEYIDKLNKPYIKNIVNARQIYRGSGFIGMNIISDSKLNIFMFRNKNEDQDNSKLDTIPYNTDMFGAVPSIDSVTFNEDYTLVYTSYDENNKGKIKSIGYTLHKYQQHPKTILEDENLYGPIRIQEYTVDDKYVKNIMYFTYEDGCTKVNICDMDGNKIKSISL
ncbi:hypothetical protein [Tepidibacter sp. Z1-5]|uniref:hypothetical protein n=1 Tax=Tepidibacter sp. Z1-5 TaxID=3134138 RepID=UPI0030BF9FFF